MFVLIEYLPVLGIAINKEGVIYVADGPNIRKITADGYITTLIGTQEQLREWTPMPCDDILSAERVYLYRSVYSVYTQLSCRGLFFK